MKIEGVYQVKGRGTVLGCSPTTRPHTGSILRHADGRVWLITGVERFCVPWSPGEKAGLLIRPAAEGQAEPVEGDDVEMVEPLTLAARCEVLEAALSEALDEFEDAIQYKLDFLVTKHGDRETLARLRALAAGTAAAAGEEPVR